MFIYVDTAEENLAKPFLTLYGLQSEKKPIVSLMFDCIGGGHAWSQWNIGRN
jgi:protein disulfide-isomerase A1